MAKLPIQAFEIGESESDLIFSSKIIETQIIHDSPVAIYTCDKEGKITFFNQAAVQLWGREPQIGVDLWCGSWRIYDTNGTPVVLEECPMAITLKEGRPVNGREIVVEQPSGERFHILPHPKPIFDEAGNLTGGINVLIDITNYRAAVHRSVERAVLGKKKAGLSLDEEQYGRIMAEVEDYAINLLNPEGVVLRWNERAERIKGYQESEIIGKNYRIFFTKEDRDADLPARLLAEAIHAGKAYTEGWCVRRDGSRFWATTTIIALRNDVHEISGFVKVTRDLTEKRMAEDVVGNYMEELRQKNEELKKSEARQYRMIDEIQDYAIILMDPEGNIENWNRGGERIKGYKAEEIIGKNFRLFYTKEDKASGLPEKLLHQAEKEGRVNHEGWRIRKDGRRFWASVTITALHNEENAIIGYSKITRDLTARKTAEDLNNNYGEELRKKNEALRRSEERYHRMVQEVQDYAILSLSKDGIIENWNKGAENIKGYRAEEVIGKSFKIFYTYADQRDGLPERLLRQALEQGKVAYEGWRVRKDGSSFWGSVVITALHDDDGHVIGFTKVTRDLTEKKTNEDALMNASAVLTAKNLELERMNQELSSFAYISSHDLQEPLRKIQMFSDRLVQFESDNLSEKGKEYLGRMRKGASRMQKLIQDLLAYSRTSTEERHFEYVDFMEVIKQAEADLEDGISQKNAVVQYGHLPKLFVIPFQFHQLIVNLLSNALKFSREGIQPVITIKADIVEGSHLQLPLREQKMRYHHIRILDNGIGFDPKYTGKIFEVFQRLHGRSEYSGTGIGLAICKRIVENHGGAITAESELGKGSTFHVYLPEM